MYEQKCVCYSCPSVPILSNVYHKTKEAVVGGVESVAHKQQGQMLLARHHKSKSYLNVHKG